MVTSAMDAILLVDDRLIENEVLQEILVESGYQVIAEAEPGRVISLVRLRSFDLVILDLSMTGQNDVELVHSLHRVQPTLPILIMTNSATIENAVVALREGAFDCLKLPKEAIHEGGALAHGGPRHSELGSGAGKPWSARKNST